MSANSPRIDRIDRNFLINGAFDYWQRNASNATNTSTTRTYISDRWLSAHTGTYTGTPNVRPGTSVPNNGFPSSLRHDFRRNAASGTLILEQRLEALDARALGQALAASVGLKVFSPIAGATIQVDIRIPTALDSHTSQTSLYLSSTTALTQNAWTEFKYENFSITPSMIANGLAIQFIINLPSATDGADQSLFMAEAMLNAGSKLSSFTRAGLSLGKELFLCQRYYEKAYPLDTAPGTIDTGSYNPWLVRPAGTEANIVVIFKVLKRAVPTVVSYSPNTGASGNVYQVDGTGGPINRAATVQSSTHGARIFATIGSAVAFTIAYWTADAEIS